MCPPTICQKALPTEGQFKLDGVALLAKCPPWASLQPFQNQPHWESPTVNDITFEPMFRYIIDTKKIYNIIMGGIFCQSFRFLALTIYTWKNSTDSQGRS